VNDRPSTAAFEGLLADRSALGLSRRHYLMHVLLRRYEPVRQHGPGFDRRPPKDAGRSR